jgi:signal transduction histidine kinase/tetratricopeptide (TPR) repeat protein
MFAADDSVEAAERQLAGLRGGDRVAPLVQLAWHLRQRDGGRAHMLAAEARSLLAAIADTPLSSALRAESIRLQLIEAELTWLAGQLDDAAEQAGRALAAFKEYADLAGCADAHWLLAWIAVDRGDHARSDAELALAVSMAGHAGDAMRTAIATAVTARWAVLHDPSLAAARWGGRIAPDDGRLPPGLATWANDFHGMQASQSRQLGYAIGFFVRSHEAALASGQLRAAITAAANTGECFAKLNDHHSALEWIQTALDLARPTGWPRSIGACLTHMADVMRRLGRLAPAHDLLHEALLTLAPVAGGRTYANALLHLGDLALDQGDYGAALDAFERLARRGDALAQSDIQSMARRGLAHALSFLDRPREAAVAAQEAVRLAARHGDSYNHIAALRVLAMLHARHTLPSPPAMSELNGALHYLHLAVTVASTIEGYILPGDLLDALAREYAGVGRYREAYEIALEAGSAREKTHGQHATDRAVAIQVHRRTERARADGLHHRELAESEARRAEVLQHTSATLQRLSAIGRELTSHRDAGAVFRTLDAHVHALVDVSTFAVYLKTPDGAMLTRAYGVEAGRPLEANTIPLTHPRAFSVRCMLEQREVYVDHVDDEEHSTVMPGTLYNQSALYVPLMVGERVLGVMSLQALRPHAYGEHERLIFRTLCAYGAIALDNALAYRQLQDAQTALVSQEKLAALGALMAGVAHELNTPIGNSLLIASTMQQKTADLENALNGTGLRRSELAAYIADAGKAAQLALNALTSAADLVNSFKQVAVDRTTEQRRRFNLAQVTHEIMATMINRIRNGGHSIDCDIDPDIALDSYPGPFGQVVTNLINNALLHAFDGIKAGRMRLTAALSHDGQVRIAFSDNGRGIAAEHRRRIFDPFFTTRLGQGGSGLGLSISYNIVTALLGGRIELGHPEDESSGTTFLMALPLSAPQPDPAHPARIY